MYLPVLREREEWRPVSVITEAGLEQGQATLPLVGGSPPPPPPLLCSITFPCLTYHNLEPSCSAISAHLNVIPDENLVIHHQFIVLEDAGHAGICSLDVPHEPPELRPALPGLPVHVLRHVDVAAPQQAGFPQYVLFIPGRNQLSVNHLFEPPTPPSYYSVRTSRIDDDCLIKITGKKIQKF